MSQASLVIQETPLDAVRLHPRNLRRQVGDVAEMAQSMKERGVSPDRHRQAPQQAGRYFDISELPVAVMPISEGTAEEEIRD
jgi:hypothetical protein